MVILAGDHIYKMDYELMLQQHVDQGADVTVGCLEVPRMEATGFGVMHVDENDRIIAFVEKPKDPPGMPGNPDLALASMGIYVFDTKFLIEQLAATRTTPGSSRDFGKDIIPYIVKNGKAVAHRFAASCVRSTRRSRSPTGATSARSTPIGRPISTSPTSCPSSTSTIRLADLDLRRDHAAGQVRARRRGPARPARFLAGLRRLHRLRRLAQALPAVHRRARQFLFSDRERGDPALRATSAAVHVSKNVVIDRGVRIPEGLVVGEDPDARRPALPPHTKGICLITQPMIDQLAE